MQLERQTNLNKYFWEEDQTPVSSAFVRACLISNFHINEHIPFCNFLRVEETESKLFCSLLRSGDLLDSLSQNSTAQGGESKVTYTLAGWPIRVRVRVPVRSWFRTEFTIITVHLYRRRRRRRHSRSTPRSSLARSQAGRLERASRGRERPRSGREVINH